MSTTLQDESKKAKVKRKGRRQGTITSIGTNIIIIPFYFSRHMAAMID